MRQRGSPVECHGGVPWWSAMVALSLASCQQIWGASFLDDPQVRDDSAGGTGGTVIGNGGTDGAGGTVAGVGGATQSAGGFGGDGLFGGAGGAPTGDGGAGGSGSGVGGFGGTASVGGGGEAAGAHGGAGGNGAGGDPLGGTGGTLASGGESSAGSGGAGGAEPIPGIVTAIASGAAHTCALMENAGVKCWGDNTYGQLGDNTTTQRSTPVAVMENATTQLGGIAGITAGGHHSCAVMVGGQVKCWGKNTDGQLGNSLTSNSPLPVQVLDDATLVSAGASHTCARMSDETVRCWGDNKFGQLGDNTLDDRPAPVGVIKNSGTANLLADVVRVTAGGAHTCARLENGEVWCWGADEAHQLGDGKDSYAVAPVKASTGSNNQASGLAVDAGDKHTCALKQPTDDPVLKCWGADNAGQVGDGQADPHEDPTDVALTDVTAIALGTSHSCARRGDSSIWCWGANGSEQLGLGNTVAPAAGTVAATLITSGAQDISAGANHSCALMNDGSVKCWGNNLFGQLGANISNPASSFPVGVIGL